jgi:hypothetical protein
MLRVHQETSTRTHSLWCPTINGATEWLSCHNNFMYMYKLRTNAGLRRLIGAGTPALLFENDRFHFEFLHQPVLP